MPCPEITGDLVAGHRNMERVLTLIRFQLDVLQKGHGAADLTLLGKAFAYMRNFPGVNHHPTEDLIFRKLLDYAPEHRALCLQLTAQHQHFGERESDLLRYVRGVQGDDVNAVGHVKDLGLAYCAEHASHIRSEETELFPEAERWLTAADWRQVARRSREMTDPELEQTELKRYDNLYDRLMAVKQEVEER